MSAVYALTGTIPLGYAGENKAREIAIDISPLARAWPELTARLVARRPGESDVYPCATRCEGDVLYWLVTGSDTALPGYGEARVQMIGEDGRIAKSAIVQTVIKGGMEGEMRSEPPPAVKPWIDAMIARIGELVSGYVRDDQGTENAGKLMYIGEDGVIAALSLGEGLRIENGVLNVTGAVVPEPGPEPEPEPEAGMVFEDLGNGLVRVGGVAIEDLGGGVVRLA